MDKSRVGSTPASNNIPTCIVKLDDEFISPKHRVPYNILESFSVKSGQAKKPHNKLIVHLTAMQEALRSLF